VAFYSARADRPLAGVLLVFALASACATSAVRPDAPREVPDAIDYAFALDAELTALRARVCFHGRAPADFMSGLPGGAAYLREAWLDTGHKRHALPLREGRLQLAGVPRDACIGYTIDLGSAGAPGSFHAQRRGGAIVTNTALWLWRPSRFAEVGQVRARFSLPEQARVLVPWPMRGGGDYTLDETAFAFYAYAVFGRFEMETISAPGATLRAAVLEGFTPSTRADIANWLHTAANAAALAAGRFPSHEGVIAVVPTPGTDRPVRFGMATRGGGASLLLLVSADADLHELERDWVAVHEFCHLLHPFVARDDAWLSEGLATYYQEVLRVRAGLLPEAEAWRRIYEGSLRGRSADGSLAQQSAAMFADRSFSMVYWAGASFALMADVELRRRTGGKVTLDQVMAELSHCCSRRNQPVPATEVITELDRIAGEPVFSELMKRWVLGPQLPDLAPLYGRLGLSPGPDGVAIDEGEDAWIRRAIMRGPAAPAKPKLEHPASAARR
jgi:hypothetical protein